MKFQKSHEWVTVEGDVATMGITDHAQSQLSDVVYVGLPEPGEEVQVGDAFMTVDSVKSSSEIYAPVAGEVVEVNSMLDDEPEKVNEAAESDAWFVKIKMSSPADVDALLSREAYEASLED